MDRTRDSKKKVLLMGKSGSGKTSMRSIIFANYLARETQRLNPTLDVQHSSVKFLNLNLSLWDCGGQDAFYENYFNSQRDHTFRNVSTLIYVFDVTSLALDDDLAYYSQTIDALVQLSPDAKIFILLHKMDLIREEDRDRAFDERSELILARSSDMSVELFKTSIWDETLYKAWSKVVHTLIPNMRVLEEQLASFAEVCDADEVVLFERATFLVISSSTRKAVLDIHRHEKVANLTKQFKLSCIKSQSQFQGLRAGNAAFTVFIDAFTANTYLMVVTSAPDAVPAEAALLNIAIARSHFERLIAEI